VEATALIAEYFRWLADLGLVDGADLTSPPPPAAVAAKPLGEG
jgi:hypothetical protein